MRYILRTVSWRPERLENVERLKLAIPSLKIIVDEVGDGYRTFLEALAKINATGGVLIEDDALLCKGFCERVEKIIDECGQGEVINFFDLRKAEFSTRRFPGRQFWSTLCIYLPPVLPGIIAANYEEFRDNHPKSWAGMATDSLIAYVLQKERLQYWKVRPNLVDHLPFKSVIGPRSTKRQSKYFVDDL